VGAADLAVIALSPGMERLAVPSRPYPFLAAGRPVIALTSPDADIALDVQVHGGGWHVGGAHELAALLRRLCEDGNAIREAAAAARTLYEDLYTRERATGRYADLVDDLLAR
jgi:glycosyltransferase involved in cell wall biosynthesis